MRIGLIAPPWAAVPSATGGGTEAVIDALAGALADSGHDVVLFATGDSTCEVETCSTYDSPIIPQGCNGAELEHVDAAYRALAHCDVVHDHTTLGPLWAATRAGLPPMVATVHGPFTVRARAVYGQVARWGVAVTALSQSQRDTAPDVAVARVIHPGLDASRIALGTGLGGSALFVGPCSAESGMHEAIRIARHARVPLRILTSTPTRELRYYLEHVVEPQLGPGVELLAEVGRDQRALEMSLARALLNPVGGGEPFAVVMVEAMLAGTPVIAYPGGAVAEIVEDGVTGVLCRGLPEAVTALRGIGSIDRRDVRRRAIHRFDARRMAQEYASLYRTMTSAGAVVPLPVPVSSEPSPGREATVLAMADHIASLSGATGRRRHPHAVRGRT